MPFELTAAMDEADVDLIGRRRYPHGEYKDDDKYWSFEEYVAFCESKGLTKQDPQGEWTAWAAALDMWHNSVDEEVEDSQAQEMAAMISQLPAAPLEDLLQAFPSALLLQAAGGREAVNLVGPKAGGGCLRTRVDGIADCWGGVGPKSLMSIEVIKTVPSLQANLRCFTGGLLRVTGEATLDFGGFPEHDDGEGTVFELLPRAGSLPLLTIAAKGGALLGTFVPRLPPAYLVKNVIGVTTPQALKDKLVAEATRLKEQDPCYRGRRRHKQDSSMRYYPFEEMLLYVQKTFQPDGSGALDLTRAIWLHACVSEVEEEAWSMVDVAAAEGEEEEDEEELDQDDDEMAM